MVCKLSLPVAMLDDIDKAFCLFAMQISPNMAKIALSFESHGSGCNHLYFVLADRKHISNDSIYKHRDINYKCDKTYKAYL